MENIVESNWSLWFVYIPVRHTSPKTRYVQTWKLIFLFPFRLDFFSSSSSRLFYPEINFPFNWANWIMCLPSKSYETFACLQKQKFSQFTQCFCFLIGLKNTPASLVNYFLKVVSNSYLLRCMSIKGERERV